MRRKKAEKTSEMLWMREVIGRLVGFFGLWSREAGGRRKGESEWMGVEGGPLQSWVGSSHVIGRLGWGLGWLKGR